MTSRGGFIRLYQQWAPFLVGVIMGWGTSDVLVAALDYQQMAILYACDEFHPVAALTLVDGFSQRLVQIIYQHSGVVCL